MKNSKRIILIVLSLMILGLISGCTGSTGAASSWPGMNSEGGEGYFAYGTQVFAIDTKNGSLEWRFPAEPDTKVQFYAAPEIGENYIYAGSYFNTLVAIDKTNGVGKWVFAKALDRYIGSPLAFESLVFAPNSDKFLYALNDSGDLLWKFEAAGPNWTKPVTDGTSVFLASMDHHLYALKMQYGSNELELDKGGSRTLVSAPIWKIDLGTAIVTNPVFMNGSIYVATLDGNLHSVNVNSGKINWSYLNGDGYRSVWGSLVATDEAVFFGDEAGNVYAVSTANGQPVWQAPFAAGASIIAGGVLTDEGPLFVNEDGKVFIINLDQEPKPVISLDMVIYASPVVADGKVILAPATKEKLFMAIDLDGKEIWSYIPSK